MSQAEAVIVIPARNEAHSIGEVISEARRFSPYPIIVVDDSSSDGTQQVARTHGAVVISLPIPLGAWGAAQAGIRFALASGYKFTITMDADGQHDPSYIGAILKPLVEGSVDVCIGAWAQRGSRSRKMAWGLLRFTSGISVADLTSGFRAYNRSAMEVLSGSRATYLEFQDVGILSLLVGQKMRITDIETVMRERASGHSRIFHSWLAVVYYMSHSLILGLAKRRVARAYVGRIPVTEPRC